MEHDDGTSGDSDDRIGRLKSLAWDGAQENLVDYYHVGLNLFAIVDLSDPDVDVQLDRTASHTGERQYSAYTDNPGLYPGFDRFGRLVRQMWVDGTFAKNGENPPDHDPWQPPIVELAYTYDKASNPETAYDDNGVLDAWANDDFEYAYDDLDRLTDAQRGHEDSGDLSPVQWTQGTTPFAPSQAWALDMLGNWDRFATDTDAGGANTDTEDENNPDLIELREHNGVNELGERTPDDTEPETTLGLTYDKNGNLIEEERGQDTYTYTYDAWNRLVGVEVDSDPRGEYVYNGLSWRIVKRCDADLTDANNALNQERVAYYTADWQLLEERVDDWTEENLDRNVQYVWGVRYIDDAILHRIDGDVDGTYEDTYYHLTDAQFSTRAIIDDSAELVERVSYTAYGEARHHRMADLTGDGATSVTDYLAYMGSSGWGVGDVNRDGLVNMSDYLAILADFDSGLTPGLISYSTVDNQIGYGGYVFDAETGHYHVRFRDFSPLLGRWLQRDPAGYVGGMSLYENVGSQPIGAMDPLGLYRNAIGDKIWEGLKEFFWGPEGGTGISRLPQLRSAGADKRIGRFDPLNDLYLAQARAEADTTRTVHELEAFFGNTAWEAAKFLAAWYGPGLIAKIGDRILWIAGRAFPFARGAVFWVGGRAAGAVGGLLDMGRRGGRFVAATIDGVVSGVAFVGYYGYRGAYLFFAWLMRSPGGYYALGFFHGATAGLTGLEPPRWPGGYYGSGLRHGYFVGMATKLKCAF